MTAEQQQPIEQAALDSPAVGQFSDTRTLQEQTESESIPWMPAREEDCPKAIYGLVIEHGTQETEHKDPETGELRVVPTAIVLDDQGVEWSLIGFHTSLGNQMVEKGVVTGNRCGLRYIGSKDPEDPKATQQYKVRVLHNPNRPAETETTSVAGASASMQEERPQFSDDEEVLLNGLAS
jgi:hypothetical protein